MKPTLLAFFLSACLAVVLVGCDGNDEDPPMESAPSATAVPPPTLPPPTPTIVATQATLVMSAPQPATVGATLSVPVRIVGATNLAAYQFTPAFDPSILELVDVVDAGFAGSTGRIPSCSLSRLETPTFFCVSGGTQPAGPSGDGDLAVLEFRAIAPGSSEITLERLEASMPDATDIPVTAAPITVAVQ